MFDLLVITLEKTQFEKPVHSVLVPGLDGYFQVLTHHAPLVAMLQPGRVEIQEHEGEKEVFAVSGGFFEVANNKATLIADAFEKASEINYQRALLSLLRAQERLAAPENIDVERAKLSMKRAENRIKIHREFNS